MVSWVLFVALGAALSWLMRITPHKIDQILIRCSAVCFITAGFIGAHGWLGGMISAVVRAISGALDAMGAAAVGSTLTPIVAVGLMGAWIIALLPDRFTRYSFQSWMVYAGLLIPSMLVSVPGTLGAGLRGFVAWVAVGTQTWVGGMIA